MVISIEINPEHTEQEEKGEQIPCCLLSSWPLPAQAVNSAAQLSSMQHGVNVVKPTIKSSMTTRILFTRQR
jgi:hypothetical protein